MLATTNASPSLALTDRSASMLPRLLQRVVGDLLELVVHSIEEMDDVLEALSDHAVTSTAVIKASSVRRRLPPLE